MSRTITRLYESKENALAAGRELVGLGVPGERISLLVHRHDRSRPPGVSRSVEDSVSSEAIIRELKQIGLGDHDARTYANRVLDGCALLSVDTPDLVAEATQIMERHGPVREAAEDRGDSRPTSGGEGSHGDSDPAPLSHLLHIPVLSDDPAPLSHLLHIPVLADD